MASQFFFNGQSYTTPVTVSDVNDNGFGPNTLGNGDVLVLVGEAEGGQPNTALTFGSPQEAAQVLLSGDLLTAANKAFSASTDTPTIPSQVTCVVVGQATPASIVLESGAAVPIIDVTSTQYGTPANRTKISVQAGSQSGYKVQVALDDQLNEKDNIGRTAFTVQYSGAQASATISITAASLVLHAPTGTAVATISLATYNTVDQLVDQINGVAGFSATIGPNASGTPTANGGLDLINTPQSVLTAYTVTSNTQAVVDWLNSSAVTLATAVNVTTTSSALASIPYTFMTGATSPAPMVSDWTTALNYLQTINLNWLVALSPDEAVWAAVDAHVQYMSAVAFKERRAFVGPALGTTLAEAEAMPLLINSDRTAICFPGYQDFDVNGNLVTLPSYQTAALVAAGFAGLRPGDAMTNKTVTARGLELMLRTPLDTDPAIQSGLLVLNATPQGYKVVRSITSWLQNNNFNRVEISCGRAVDFVMATVRAAVDQQRGGRQGPQLLGFAVALVESLLTDLAVPEPQGPGVLVGDANSPAFQNITGSIQGDNMLLNWEMSPVIPNNFIGCTATLNAYSGTASV